jgi:hypothetical protein
MRVIFPLLITALWASVAIDIEGVWPPVHPAREFQDALAQLEAPANSLLAQIQDSVGLETGPTTESFKPIERPSDLRHRITEIRIALPSIQPPRMPRPAAQPVCG